MDISDAAISRDPAGKTGGPRTEDHNAWKLQDTIETFYACVSKQYKEEMVCNDYEARLDHFIDQNEEAAVQGK